MDEGLADRAAADPGAAPAATIAFFGDSLTEGSPGAAFLPLLARRFGSFRLLNHGRAGDTVADLLARAARTGAGAVDLAFIWVGVNDAVMATWGMPASASAHDWGERLAQARGDYEESLGWVAARARRTVCVLPIVLEHPGSEWERNADELGESIARVCDGVPGAETLDLRPAFAAAAASGQGPFTIDGVHFTSAGAAVVAGAFANVIDAAVDAVHGSDASDARAHPHDPGGPP